MTILILLQNLPAAHDNGDRAPGNQLLAAVAHGVKLLVCLMLKCHLPALSTAPNCDGALPAGRDVVLAARADAGWLAAPARQR